MRTGQSQSEERGGSRHEVTLTHFSVRCLLLCKSDSAPWCSERFNTRRDLADRVLDVDEGVVAVVIIISDRGAAAPPSRLILVLQGS